MRADAAPPAGGAIGEAGHPRRWWILGVLCSSLTLLMVTNSSLNLALPSIARDLERVRL